MQRYLKQPLTQASVSTLTPLSGWLDLGGADAFMIAVINDDGANNVNLIIETSEDTAASKKPDSESVRYITIPAGKQGSEEVRNHIRRFWRFSAETDSPGFPTVSLRWTLTMGQD